MAFFGKEFVLESQENFDGFVESFGADAPDALKKALVNHKATAKLVKEGDGYKLISSNPDNSSREVSFKSGVEFDDNLHGREVKTTITLDGNVLTQVQKFENGIVFTIKREFSDNGLVTTITSSAWDGVAKRVYKA